MKRYNQKLFKGDYKGKKLFLGLQAVFLYTQIAVWVLFPYNFPVNNDSCYNKKYRSKKTGILNLKPIANISG
jgi:hypothetical protein